MTVIHQLLPNDGIGNQYARSRVLTKGHRTHGHKHKFHHITFVVHGSLKVIANLPTGQVERDFGWNLPNGFWVGIDKDIEHDLIALEDDTVYVCVYACRNPETGEVIEYYNGWETAFR